MQRDSADAARHAPVMPQEVLRSWLTDKDGIYVDGTLGRGGHSRLLLEQLSLTGKLYAFDRDVDAISAGAQLQSEFGQLSLCHAPFSEVHERLDQLGLLGKVQGVLLDLGVSSPQLDTAERGFSFMRGGKLDMRMDTSVGETAEQWLRQVSEADLCRVLQKLGEEPFAGKIAKAIVDSREERPLETTLELAALIERTIPAAVRAKSKVHAATRSFQAIRLFINDELGELERFLNSCLDLLMPGGRLVVISFHSLEDRIVKRFIRDGVRGLEGLSSIPLTEQQMGRTLKNLGGAQRPSSEEVSSNPRSRSAILRVAEKL